MTVILDTREEIFPYLNNFEENFKMFRENIFNKSKDELEM